MIKAFIMTNDTPNGFLVKACSVVETLCEGLQSRDGILRHRFLNHSPDIVSL